MPCSRARSPAERAGVWVALKGVTLKHFRNILVAGTPEEAVRLRKQAGIRALYIAGGTMVVPLAARSVEVLVDIGRLDLAGVAVGDGMVSIGATTRLADLLTLELKREIPLVWNAAARCATPIIRNMATVGGAVAVAHLPSDLAVALLAAGASLDVVSEGAAVTTTAADLLARGWLKGPELVCSVAVPRRGTGEGTSFQKFGRSAIDIAIVNAAARITRSSDGTVADLRLAVGQSSALPVLVGEVAATARGKRPTRSMVAELGRAASAAVKPKADFRASAEYRHHLVEVMAARAIAGAIIAAGWKLEA
jgi:carbon-monoxide dehydrogenase medium subunit